MIQQLNKLLQAQFNIMCSSGKLFRVNIPGQELWDLYLNSFLPKYNTVFRSPESSEHNCNHCKNFMRRYANIVSINDKFEIVSIFDLEGVEDEYFNSIQALSEKIKNAQIIDIFQETYEELNALPYGKCTKTSPEFQLGVALNHKIYTVEEANLYGHVEAGKSYAFNHMHLSLPKAFVDCGTKSIESIQGFHRDNKTVFERLMNEVSVDTLELVRDLINQGSLLDGTTHLHKIEKIIPLMKEYKELSSQQKNSWLWTNSYNFQFAKFRNELIGTLCVDLSQGMELNEAVRTWNKRVDPANYMKVTAPFTERQRKEAEKTIEELGYEDSFDRRMATIDDIDVSLILHANAGDGKIPKISVLSGLKATATRHKKSEFKDVETVHIDKFMKDILPTVSQLEVFLTNNQEGNLVTLTTAKDKNSKCMFKYGNNFSRTFKGNLAGKSMIKEEVKSKGGNVEGVLRFSMIWNDNNQNDGSDLDAWCKEPGNVLIGYNTGYRRDRGNSFSPSSGQLDLDNTNPNGKIAVENIYYESTSKMKNGTYKFWVRQFSARNSKGFKCEIEFDGQIYSYSYNQSVSGDVQVAEVTLKDGQFSIKHILPAIEGEGTSKELYNLETNQFHKVGLVCLSPNHWNEPIGNKYFIFMLEGCKSDTPIRSFHIEDLVPELAVHRKVLEPFGAVTMVDSIDKQLSGLAFNSTVREELIVKIKGSHQRLLKIQF